MDVPEPITVAGADFRGCTSNNADLCACETWEPTFCSACDKELHDGDEAYAFDRPSFPWLPDDHADQDWDRWIWHKACDERVSK